MHIYTWNVNGIRSCMRKGFLDWLAQSNADIVCLQETRISHDKLDEDLISPLGYHAHYVAASKPGYSGVGLLSRKPPDQITTSLGIKEFDDEGRLQISKFGKLIIVNCYFPNGSGKNRDNSRVPYKLSFCQKLFETLEPLKKKGAQILVLGDFNVAHREIDIARPKQNEKTSGFLPEEREEFERWVQSGWVDTFRHFEPNPHHYTWWSQRFGVREKNIGWRIDYILASQNLLPSIQSVSILPNVTGSDHCPVHIEMD